MADAKAHARPSAVEAAAAVIDLGELSADVRGSAVVDGDGSLLASSGDDETWAAAAKELVDAADAAAGETASHAHIGTEDGEVFFVREGELSVIVAANRFALAGLMLFDIRSILRGLRRGAYAKGSSAGGHAEAA